MNRVQQQSPAIQYSSKMTQWEESASVRASPRRVPAPDELQTKLFFPEGLVPIASHPEVRKLGPGAARYLQVQRLYAYEAFTAKLEREVVNPVVLRIAEGQLSLSASRQCRRDADKIYTDEARHAQCAYDLTDLVEAATGIAPAPIGEPLFLDRLRRRVDRTPVAYRQLAYLFYTVVSETLISAILAQIPQDERVVTAVREQVADHARDEAQHHRFFVYVMQIVWPLLTPSEHALMGPMLADFVDWFLAPDFRSMRVALLQLVPSDTADLVLHESYPAAQRAAAMRDAAGHTLRLFERTGVFEDPGARDAFECKGLIAA